MERLSGEDYRELVRRRIALPLGLPRLRVGLPPEAAESEGAAVAELVIRGEPATPEELMAVLGVPELPVTEVTNEALVEFNEPRRRALGVPGGGGVMTAADLALFYQALLHNPGGLWDPGVLAEGTGRVRTALPDPLLGMPSLRTLGIVVAGDDFGEEVGVPLDQTAHRDTHAFFGQATHGEQPVLELGELLGEVPLLFVRGVRHGYPNRPVT